MKAAYTGNQDNFKQTAAYSVYNPESLQHK